MSKTTKARKSQPRTTLREASSVRTVGFADAVRDLGTHEIHGRQMPYSAQQVRKVLKGESKSKTLLKRIARRRPDLFTLRFVGANVKTWFVKEG